MSEGSRSLRDDRSRRIVRDACDTAAYLVETTRDRIEEARREIAWLRDTSPGRPSFFVPYGLGWERYA